MLAWISSYAFNANKYSRFWFAGYSWYLNYMNFLLVFHFISLLCWKCILFFFMTVLTRECLIFKINSYFCWIIFYVTYISGRLFLYHFEVMKSFQFLYIKSFELGLDISNYSYNKKTAIMMHPSPTIRVISLVNFTCSQRLNSICLNKSLNQYQKNSIGREFVSTSSSFICEVRCFSWNRHFSNNNIIA